MLTSVDIVSKDSIRNVFAKNKYLYNWWKGETVEILIMYNQVCNYTIKYVNFHDELCPLLFLSEETDQINGIDLAMQRNDLCHLEAYTWHQETWLLNIRAHPKFKYWATKHIITAYLLELAVVPSHRFQWTEPEKNRSDGSSSCNHQIEFVYLRSWVHWCLQRQCRPTSRAKRSIRHAIPNHGNFHLWWADVALKGKADV